MDVNDRAELDKLMLRCQLTDEAIVYFVSQIYACFWTLDSSLMAMPAIGM